LRARCEAVMLLTSALPLVSVHLIKLQSSLLNHPLDRNSCQHFFYPYVLSFFGLQL